MMGHPAERRLIGFLDGSLADGKRRGVAAHLADCQRCRDVVQAHRLNRLALTGDPAAPPIATLGRVLATRASGGGVILPVDVEREQRAWSFNVRHLKLGAIGAALVAVVVALTRVPLPDLMPQRGFNGFGATLQEVWSNALRAEEYGEVRRLGPLPDAPAATLDPSRMREMSVRYESKHYREGQLVSVDSQSGFRVRRIGDTWQVMATEKSWWSHDVVIATFDVRTLAPLSSHEVSRYEDTTRNRGWMTTTRLEFSGDTMVSQFEHMTSFRSGDGIVREHPDSLTNLRISPAANVPIFRNRIVRSAVMTTVPMSRRWFGSFDRLSLNGTSARIRRVAERVTESHRVTGTASLDLPIGVTPTWEVERWTSWGPYSDKEYYRQSDGLLAAEFENPADGDRTDIRLLSVSYP